MKRIDISKLGAQCVSILDHLEPEGLVITKHGEPVAQVVPYPTNPADLIGSMRGEIEVVGDLMSTGLSWEANE